MLPTLVQNDTVKGKLVSVPYFTEARQRLCSKS
jgi:hypothetical protein